MRMKYLIIMDLLGLKGTCYYHDHGFNREAHHQNQQMCEQFSKAFRNLAKNWAGIRRGHCYLGNRMQMFVFLFCVCVFFCVCIFVLMFVFVFSGWRQIMKMHLHCLFLFLWVHLFCPSRWSLWLFVLIISGSLQHYDNLFCLFVYLVWEGEYDFAV